jgi:hypothetical protein
MKRFSLLLAAMLGTVHAMAAVVLPIEVLGEPGHVESVEVPLPAGSPEVTAMSLRVHGLNSQNKMSIRINESPDWITLNRGNVSFPFPDGKLFGMSGAQGTIRMIVPLPRGIVRPGQNVVRFRFNDEDGISIGYRVLAFNFLASPDSQSLVPASEFVQEDPSAWRPPLDSAEAIAEGKKLWYSAPLWDDGRPIRVSCSECHAHDGRDLKYFNYSSKSIIARSIYHRLTQDQGTRIASYIRSLPVPYEANGRPWNPPYQPGPGLDSKPVRSWAAGAGLEWVLDRDYDTLKYIFPDEASVDSYRFSKMTNPREIPIYIQFPDWNHWLTARHPIDLAIDQGKPPGWIPPLVDSYKEVRAEVQKKMNSEGRLAALQRFVFMCNEIWNRTLPSGPSGIQVSHWRITKIWEIMQEFEFEGEAKAYFGPQAHSRSWYAGEVFRAAPHLNNSQTSETWDFESMLWYQLQVVLNDSNRKMFDTHPIAFEYLQPFSKNWGRPGLPPSYSLMLIDKIKAGEASADYGVLAGDRAGWYANLTVPDNLFERGWVSSEIDRLNPDLKNRIAIALSIAWLEKSERFSPEDYRKYSYTEERLRARSQPLFSTIPIGLESIGASPELVQRARNFVIGINPELGTPPTPPTNLRRN